MMKEYRKGEKMRSKTLHFASHDRKEQTKERKRKDYQLLSALPDLDYNSYHCYFVFFYVNYFNLVLIS